MKKLALLIALSASACSALPTEDYRQPGNQTTSVTRTAYEAWAMLPPTAGTIAAVSEETTPRRHSQRIVYGGVGSLPGENAITVAMAGPDGADTELLQPPREEIIAAEIRTALADVPVERNTVLETNAYGPFGVATGSASDGINCVYAWQWIEGSRSALTLKKNPVSIRVRYCGKATTDDLIALMRGLRLNINGGMVTANAGPSGYSIPRGGDALDIAAGSVARY